jgi:hypothetical protein
LGVWDSGDIKHKFTKTYLIQDIIVNDIETEKMQNISKNNQLVTISTGKLNNEGIYTYGYDTSQILKDNCTLSVQGKR